MIWTTLEHPEIYQNSRLIRLEEISRTSNFACRAVDRDFHVYKSVLWREESGTIDEPTYRDFEAIVKFEAPEKAMKSAM
jgi:hypothetical protein